VAGAAGAVVAGAVSAGDADGVLSGDAAGVLDGEAGGALDGDAGADEDAAGGVALVCVLPAQLVKEKTISNTSTIDETLFILTSKELIRDTSFNVFYRRNHSIRRIA